MVAIGIRKTLVVFSIVATFVFFPGKDAGAIVWGAPDVDPPHPYVGFIVTPIGDGLAEFCSGALFAPTVFVTAAHCVDDWDGTPIFVFFGPGPGFTALYVALPGLPVPNPVTTHPEFIQTGDGPDVAVVQLFLFIGTPPDGHAVLPQTDYLTDQFAQPGAITDRLFETVGYGTDGVEAFKGVGAFVQQEIGTRQVAQQILINLFDDNYAQFSAAPGNGQTLSGGPCLGDSGGPVLKENTDTAVAINSFGTNENCAGLGFAQRLDSESVQGFINSFLP